MPKPVIPRAQAHRDVDDAIAYYLSEDAEQAALGFIDALEEAYGHIGRHPATGSPRYAPRRPPKEHPFRVLKRQFGYLKVRYRGLKKNTPQIKTLFALSNLRMARHKLMGAPG